MRLVLLLTILFFLPQQDITMNKDTFVKGVYGNPGTLFSKDYSYHELGVNAIFVRSISLNQQLYNTSKKQEIKIYVEFPMLHGKEYLKKYPEAYPINEKGEAAQPADWFMGICPTDPGFRSYRIEQLRSILNTYNVDGIWLDYLHWHAQFETPEPILPETCFCDHCIERYQQYAKVHVPGSNIPEKAEWILTHNDSSWRAWRSSILTGWVSEMKNIVKETRPDALLGIFYCPWYPTDYDGALYRNLGIDLKELAGLADVFSPMLFHKMMDRSTNWVNEYTVWLYNQFNTFSDNKPLIWPIVQAHNHPEVISPEEFREVMINGAKAPSTGIMMFSDVSLLDDINKIQVMKELYLQDFKIK